MYDLAMSLQCHVLQHPHASGFVAGGKMGAEEYWTCRLLTAKINKTSGVLGKALWFRSIEDS